VTRLTRWIGAAAAVLLVLNLLGQRPTELRRTTSPAHPAADVAVDAAAATDVATSFLRAALSAQQGVDWTGWATPRLAAVLAHDPARGRARLVLRTLEVDLLVHGERSARAAVQATFVGPERTVAVALVLELVLTPAGWRVDRIAS